MTAPRAALPVVGRDGELGVLAELVRGAVDGRFGAVIVEGDAGIGKTTLVRAACQAAGDDVLVLPGACLPLTSVSVPLLGLRSAVRALRPEERPDLSDTTSPLPVVVDDWISERSTESPVVLVVDDLQWSDPATLDALMYLLAGPADRHLAMLLTLRSGEATAGDHLSQWLAGARRLPGVADLWLGPLSHEEMAEHAARVLGGPAHTSLVDEVQERSGGNPYLATLLLRGLDASALALPDRVADHLRSAVEQLGRGLSAPAHGVCVGLAVGGRPADSEELRRIGDIVAVDDVPAAAREGIGRGILELDPAGALWFHHPLHAEVLEQSLLPDERRDLHRGFAEELAALHAREGSAEVAELVANHHHLAGRPEEALRWAFAAADSARTAGDTVGQLRMLRRALVLGDGSLGPGERVELLDEVRTVADRTGDWAAEVEAVEGLIALLDVDAEDALEENERLRLAALLVRRNYLLLNLTRGVTDGDTARALRLTELSPGSDVRRLALGAHADNLIWAARTEQARPLVEEALHGDAPTAPPPGVDAWGSPTLRSWAVALRAAATLAEDDEETVRSRDLAGRAADLALAAGDLCIFVVSAVHEAETGYTAFTTMFVERIETCRRRLQHAGDAPHYLTFLDNSAAIALFITGRPQECTARIRAHLGSDHAAFGEVRARQTAALLAAAQGRVPDAEAHLARATELTPGLATDPTVAWCWCRATVSVMAGDAEGAVEMALAGRSSRVPRGGGCEWLMPLAARGLADLAREARDRGDDPRPVLARVDDLVSRNPTVIADVTPRDDVYGRVLDGLDALYRAEVARARAAPTAADTWVDAVTLLGETELAWDEAYACWRAGEALLSGGGAEQRRRAAEVLRRGHALATRLGARPVLDAVESLARSARIRLDVVAAPGPDGADAIPGASVSLTRREQQVLGHVVAGRTYGEIAEALFLSEKTVSSHISNILRKTGTANRVELAAWATRTGAG